ncbi:MAG: winged helix-turn-helix domain-containing protein [Candidatus Limnocylindrales bacterium]
MPLPTVVWGPGFVDEDQLVDLHVAELRRKLGDGADRERFVEAVGALGYRLASID